MQKSLVPFFVLSFLIFIPVVSILESKYFLSSEPSPQAPLSKLKKTKGQSGHKEDRAGHTERETIHGGHGR